MIIALSILAALIAILAASYIWSRIKPRTPQTSIEIDASAEQVWSTLTDFTNHPQWNPFITKISGEPITGTRLSVEISNNGKTNTFTPTVLAAEPGRELRWIGRFGMVGVVDGEHYFHIETLTPKRIRLIHGEKFTGVLVPFLGKQLDVADNFAAMNRALKARVEQQ
ncbi:MAG: SRPBCC domain-containing protein [Corynebacteriales bacterium]|nr:SRPBCC domain-containing protein [Mycobacteriales bacterium]